MQRRVRDSGACNPRIAVRRPPKRWTVGGFLCAYESSLHILPFRFSQPNPLVPRGVLGRCCAGRGSRKGSALLPVAVVPIFVRQNSDTRLPGRSVPRRETEKQRANRAATGPTRPEAKSEENEDRRSCRQSATPRRVYSCVHRDPKEAELSTSKSGSYSSFVGCGNHCIHPW